MNKKAGAVGVIVLWIGIIFAMFLTTVVYIVMSDPFNTITALFTPSLSAANLITYEHLEAQWNSWPIVFTLGLFVAGIIGTILLSRDNQYYG